MLLPLVLFGQKAQARHFALRAKADFETARKAEAEIDSVVEHLVRQSELIMEVLRHVERVERSPDALRADL